MPRIRNHVAFVAATVASGLFLGCNVGPKYQPPVMEMPEAFSEYLPGTAATRPTTGPSTRPGPIDLARWWESLDDAELDSLIHRAIESGLDLRIAVARLQEAREQEVAVLGGSIPGLGSSPGIGFTAVAARGTGNHSTAGREPGSINAAFNGTGFKEVTHEVGFDATWELDLFGRVSQLTDAVHADTQAATEARNEVLITLVADVARNYVEVRTLQLRLAIAREYVATEERTVKLVRVRRLQLIGDQLDVALAERQLSAALSRVAPLEAAIAAAERRVAVLLGQFPQTLREELERPGSLPATPPGIAAGMPAALLRRRPDLRRAERQLAAATARVGVATADMFPRVVLISGAGFEGQGLGRTPVMNKEVYSIGPSLYWSFLDFGRLEAVAYAQSYQGQQVFLTYRRTVINAVREVDDGLTGYAASQDQLQRLSDAVASSREAVKLASERFQNGLTDFLNVLDAQRSLDDLEDQFAVAQQARANQFISLYKALGGGWEGYETPAPPVPRPAIVAAGARILNFGNPVSPSQGPVAIFPAQGGGK